MRSQTLTALLAALSVAAATAASAHAFSPPGNRISNPGAEVPVLSDAWQGSGFSSVAYGEAQHYPTLADAQQYGYGDGSRLFAAPASGASLSQKVDLSDLAAAIDAGTPPFLSFGGSMGAQGDKPDGVRLVVQMLDGSDTALGAPRIVGPPTAADREHKTTMLQCSGGLSPPIGTRAAQITVQAVGPAGASTSSADALYLSSAAIGGGGADEHLVPAQGPGCKTRIRIPQPPQTDPPLTNPPDPCASNRRVTQVPPPPPAAPTPSCPTTSPGRAPRLASLMLLPATNRCRRSGPLRFRVARAWRSKVSRVSIRARGKSVVRSETTAVKPIVIARPSRRLLVTISVRLTDGRERSGKRRFRACR